MYIMISKDCNRCLFQFHFLVMIYENLNLQSNHDTFAFRIHNVPKL